MRTKIKMSITIDEEIFQGVEQAAKEYNMAKSHLAQEAFQLWLVKKNEELMARGYEEMAREDRELADSALEAQREILT